MRVYEATVIDKCAGAEPISYESYIAVLDNSEQQYDVYMMDRETDLYITAELGKHGLNDEEQSLADCILAIIKAGEQLKEITR